nr:MAG TPA: hypothetical protein [Caudoviricetes sp.]
MRKPYKKNKKCLTAVKRCDTINISKERKRY